MWICHCENGMRAGPTILHSSSLIKPLLLPGLIPIKVILESVLRKILSINVLLTRSPTYKWECKSRRRVSLPVTFLLESPHRVAASTSSLNTSPSSGWHKCLLSGGAGRSLWELGIECPVRCSHLKISPLVTKQSSSKFQYWRSTLDTEWTKRSHSHHVPKNSHLVHKHTFPICLGGPQAAWTNLTSGYKF